MKISQYHNSFLKRFVDLAFAIFFALITLPISIIIFCAIKITSNGNGFFFQKRTGIDGKVFRIIKFRTMVNNATKMQSRLKNINEADGPVFKISNDPRFTKFGRMLSRTGLDELPQFVNVIKGEMSIVGPRPLPLSESMQLSKSDKIRERVKPGITSSWVIKGSHELSFRRWMELDRQYVNSATFLTDIYIIWKTFLRIGNFIFKIGKI